MAAFLCDGRSSLASQPTASVFMGSTAIETRPSPGTVSNSRTPAGISFRSFEARMGAGPVKLGDDVSNCPADAWDFGPPPLGGRPLQRNGQRG